MMSGAAGALVTGRIGQTPDRHGRWCRLIRRIERFARSLVLRVDLQKFLQAEYSLPIVPRNAGKPEPGRLVVRVKPDRLLQKFARLILLACLCGLNASLS